MNKTNVLPSDVTKCPTDCTKNEHNFWKTVKDERGAS